MILSQIISDSAAAELVTDESISILDLAVKGGVIMIPLALMWTKKPSQKRH